jgi:hypothetical protein
MENNNYIKGKDIGALEATIKEHGEDIKELKEQIAEIQCYINKAKGALDIMKLLLYFAGGTALLNLLSLLINILKH